MVILETERMILRSIKQSDVDNLLQIFSDPVAMAYYPSTKNKDEAFKWIEWTQRNYVSHGIGLWVAELKANKQFVGQCGLVPQNVEGEEEIEIGYLFVRNHWGQGLASECAIACRDYGFNNLGYERFVSLIDKRNRASIRVAEKNGMLFEREFVKKDKPLCSYAIHERDLI